MTAVLILGLLIILLFIYFGRSSKSKRVPSGPRGLPLLGNITQVIDAPHLKLSKWAEEYGKLYTIKMGRLNTLVISDAKLMKGIFNHPAALGKFKTDTMFQISKGPYGVTNTEGTLWQEQRNFFIRTLAHHGLGSKASMEPLILSEIQKVVDGWKGDNQKEISVALHETVQTTIGNILWTTVTHARSDGWNSQKATKLTKNLEKAIHYTVKSGLVFLPWLKYIAPKLSGYDELVRSAEEFHDYVEQLYNERKQTYTPGAPRDMIDSYLEQMDKHRNNPSSSFYGSFGLTNNVAAIVELFIAGNSTTVNTIRWLLLYLVYHQDIQAKMQKEIDGVVGHSREPSLSDRQNMPYTVAVIQETMRKASLALLGVIHELLEDVDMYGYKLPKGMALLPNIYHAHHDKEVWGDPENFRPERFLVTEGSVVKVIKSELLVPFQAGKRVCPGEALAKDVIFLFVTKLFQAFQFFPDADKPIVSLEPDVGYHLLPKPFKMRIQIRGEGGRIKSISDF